MVNKCTCTIGDKKKVLELGYDVSSPTVHRWESLAASKPSCLAWTAAFKHPCPSLGRPVTRGDSTLAVVRWARDRAALSVVVKSSTVNAKFWDADNTRESTLCHSFTRQLSESTCKPFIQHLIKAPLEGWTESTAYTELCSKQQTGAVQGAVHGGACSPEASLQDGFLEGTIDEILENKAAGHQPV